MTRRGFLGLVVGAAAWPSVALGQQLGNLPTVGFLGAGANSAQKYFASIVVRLHELGWVEGQNVTIEYRSAGGRNDRLAEIAAELVRLKADVIVTQGTPATLAAKRATSIIPIVFAPAGDPVGNGLVTSLARPGGNITGLSIQQNELAGKRIELLRDVLPGLRRLAILGNVGNPSTALDIAQVQATAHALGIDVAKAEIRRAEDIALAFEAIKGRTDALYIASDPLLLANRMPINILALAARLPTIFSLREYAEAGGLMSYGPNRAAYFRRAGEYIDKILRGSKPADIPVEQPTKFELVINQTTAKALGITVPPKLLFTADGVME